MRATWRKIYIGGIALQVLLGLFLLFVYIGGHSRIKVQAQSSLPSQEDFPQRSGKVGPVGLGNIEQARFVNFHPDKTISREFGFEQLLHQDGDLWQIDKPYMNIYQSQFECRITADNGEVVTDDSSATPAVEDVTLIGNVVVQILPKPGGKVERTTIYLDDIVFIGDRSLFQTAGPVKIVSRDSQLLGRGLELVYNYEEDRLELFRIVRLETLCLNRVSAKSSWLRPDSDQSKASREEIDSESAGQKPSEQKYQIVFNKNVLIKGPEQLIYARDTLTARNLIRPDESVTDTIGDPAGSEAESSDQNSDEEYVDIVITCDGPLVVGPIANHAERFGMLKAERRSGYPAAGKAIELARQQGKDSLLARAIDYDAITRQIKVDGPYELTFHVKNENRPAAAAQPVTITAKRQLSFEPAQNKLRFEGDCVCSFTKLDTDPPRAYTLSAPLLDVFLSTWQKSSKTSAATSIKHITAPEGAILAFRPATHSSQTTTFSAAQMRYGFGDEGMMATGPCRLTLSAGADAGRGESIGPAVVTAEKDVRFDPVTNEIVFRGNCVGETYSADPASNRNYSVSAEKLIAQLTEAPQNGYFSAAGLKRLIATGGAVATAKSRRDKRKLAEFAAETIEYDAPTRNVIAPGPSRLALYAKDPNISNTDMQLPVTITAQKGSLFSLSSYQALFSGDCVATMLRIDSGIVRKYKLSSPHLTVELTRDSDNSDTASAIQYLLAGDGAQIVVTPVDSITELARFKATRIKYSAFTSSITADGPVDFTFYANDFLPNQTLGAAVPVKIMAKDNARFLPESERITFEGDCVCTMVRAARDWQSKYTLSAPRIVIDTAKDSSVGPAASAIAIRHFSAEGGKVHLSNVKTEAGRLGGFSKIKCAGFDYDTDRQMFYATGPGLITLDNSKVHETGATRSKVGLKKRCYAFLRDFENLRYNLKSNRISAWNNSQKMLLDYFPIEDDAEQEQVRASASEIQIKLTGTPQSEIAQISASGGITYEDDRNQFMGGEFNYDAATAMVNARASRFGRCYLNGALVDNIKYNLSTRTLVNLDVSDPSLAHVHKRP